MKSLFALLLCFMIPTAMFAGDTGDYKIVYRGGSLSNVKSGTRLQMAVAKENVRFSEAGREILTLPAKSIVEISYGRDVHRRVGTAIGLALITPFGIGGLAALSKSKKHYIGLTWANGSDKGGLAMQCDKNEYRGVLAALEAVSGKLTVKPDALTVP